MAKTVVRANLRQFGKDGASGNFGQFGSVRAGSPINTKSIDLIQALSAWLTGWQSAVVDSNKAPFLEDMNSMMFVIVYQLFYILQEGIAEWNTDTTYFIGSMVRKTGTNEIYSSLTNDNAGNALPVQTDSINWKFVYPVRFSTLVGSIDAAQIPSDTITQDKIADDAVGTSQIIAAAVTDSKITDMDAAKLTSKTVANGFTGLTKKLFNITAYTGNGTNGRTVPHGMGQTPDLVIVLRLDTTNETPAIWATGFTPTWSRLFSGSASATLIEGVDAANVTLGTSVVNPSGAPMLLLCFKSQ